MRFKTTAGKINFPELEQRILNFWDDNLVFDKLRRKNEKGKRWSFLDGPVTANNSLGVHHGWGRTYKDVYLRYHGMLGERCNYQNGFDCQGLWLEVEVEKALDLRSKHQIHDFGLANFSQKCRERVELFAGVITQQSKRLGQWMQWDNSYYTMSNDNIQTIWHFLAICEEKGLLVKGNKVMPWCPRCGTSLSQHEMADSYKEITTNSVYVKLAIMGRDKEFLLVWTTTPWTLPANSAVAVHPDLEYVKIRPHGSEDTYWICKDRENDLFGSMLRDQLVTVKGQELVGLEYTGPLDKHLDFQANTAHRVVPWTMVSRDEGTGMVHIAPGCGAEDYELARQLELPVYVPVNESGDYVDGYAWMSGKNVRNVSGLVVATLSADGLLYEQKQHKHRYPHCWRCHTSLIFRLCDEWFLKVEPVRAKLEEEARKIEWIPAYSGQLMQNWLHTMGDWCISRRRFWGLPLPFWRCGDCGKHTVVSSINDLKRRACNPRLIDGMDLHRPWIDDVKIVCRHCNSNNTRRVEEVGDCWLDAGIVPLSTLNYMGRMVKWRSFPQWSSDCDMWTNFPFDFATEMREQVRLWFYSCLFMSVVLEGRTPFKTLMTYEDMRDEKGEPFSKTKGNAPKLNEVIDKYGADVLRYVFCQAPLNQPFRFGYGPLQEAGKKLLSLWNCYNFFAGYANIDNPKTLLTGKPKRNIDRWVCARLQKTVRTCRRALDSYNVSLALQSVEEFVNELSTWYIRVQRPVFSIKGIDDDKQTAYEVLAYCLKTVALLLAPMLPFTAEELYQRLVIPSYDSAPESVHLCEYPDVDTNLWDEDIIVEMGIVQEAVSLALALRDENKIKVRQPLAWASFALTKPEHRDMLARNLPLVSQELNVNNAFIVDIEQTGAQIRRKMTPTMTAHLNIELTDELRHQGMARDLIRHIQEMRKKAGLTPKDSITVWIATDPNTQAIIDAQSGRISDKTTAHRLDWLRLEDSRISETVTLGEAMVGIGIEVDNAVPLNPT